MSLNWQIVDEVNYKYNAKIIEMMRRLNEGQKGKEKEEER